FELEGSRLKGRWGLIRMDGGENEGKNNWLLIKENDEFVKSSSGISRFKKSAGSGRTMEEIAAEEGAAAKKNPFNTLSVELAKPMDSVPEAEDMLYEIKFDGYRIAAFCEAGEVRLITRKGLDYASKYPQIVEKLKELSAGRAMVLDGELIATDKKGKSDFHALQSYAKAAVKKPLKYMVFDLPSLDGRDLRELPLVERKTFLKELLKDAPPEIAYSEHFRGKGGALLTEAAKLGLEGIVGKRATSPYIGGRSGDWIKIKCRPRQEFVIGGYTRTSKREKGLSALLLGFYEGGELVYAGRAGTGFTESESISIEKELKKLVVKDNPFSDDIKASKNEKLYFLEPRAVAEIEYAELIEGKKLRQASFIGLREDKAAEEVVLERESDESNTTEESAKNIQKPASDKGKPEVAGVIISNPERVIYREPREISKLEVAEYYERVASRMLPYAGGRILSVVRCHKGVSGECFFKKHPAGRAQGIKVANVKNSKGEKEEYFCITDIQGLVGQAQLGTLEFHTWGSRSERIEHPDMMVFDLDPDEGMELEQVRQGVRDLKGLLDSLSLKCFLKTSGGKGYHIVLPFEPASNWERFHDFAEGMARLMEEKWPERYTANVRKSRRKGKIFIDWIRNGRGATSIAPYSLRARPGAKVSMPISWRELGSVPPDGIDLQEALRRLKRADPWREYFSVSQRLK
ncbi:MAG: DNA ligase D, partial [Oscillospiraceae bacterium]|nr:DNA ligase D [Oscillospiraceae bacterium]